MTTREDIDAIPSKYYETIAHYILGLKNLSSKHDLSKPMLRLSVIKIYPLLILIYSVLIAVGVAANITMIIHISKNKLYRDPTYAFLINIAISDIIKCIIVLPITLAVLLIQNWVFGKFLCLSLAMIQDIPFHVSMLTYLLIATDRYRLLSDPGKPRIPAFVCALGSWFFAICIVLPFPIYTTYLDLSDYKTEYFNGLGICLGNLIDDIQQYMRGLFLLTYIAPLTVTAYIYVKSSRELQNKEDPSSTIAIFQARRKDSSRHDSDVSANLMAYREGKCGSGSLTTTTATIGFSGYTANTYDLEIDVRREIRTQKYLIFMVSFYAILLCPLMVLKPTKERLKGYFQSSSRRLTKVCEEGVSISTRRSLHQNNIHSGLANVAYTQHPRTTNNSSNGSNEGEGIHCSPGNLSIRSAEFDNNNAQIMYLVR
ncbi:neuropeptide F receptor isoform X3 [Microplitis mediator]|uniref:neuropeptide F receptor isoform X3 n=1 Tax=Microplitis mediator TaxID=375433 RepID=UPI00255439C6|nr:neuropeptide F receptor isoform X3 [Microplitis mediator]